MKEIFNDGINKIVKFNKEDFEVNSTLVDDCTRISSSYETINDDWTYESAKQDLQTKFFEYFELQEDANVFVLYNDEKPIGFVIYTKDEDMCILEDIMINKNYCGMGFGTKLSFETMKNLKENDINEVVATVNNKNIASQYLQNAIMRFCGMNFLGFNEYENRKAFHYDISGLESMEEEAETM